MLRSAAQVGRSLCMAALLVAGAFAHAQVTVLDDRKQRVTLPGPAQRIVSLSPHATELLFAAGAGRKLVGVIEYSDYPAAAKKIPVVGNATMLDLERIIAAKPDLVVIWGSGNLPAQISKLRALGIPVFDSEPRDFESIASSLERLAHLAGTDEIGKSAAAAFRTRLAKLTDHYRQREPVAVFYQVWRDPLMTLNDTHMVSAAIRLCGGTNIFGGLPQIAPTVSMEEVLKANPEVIISGGSAKEDVLSGWRHFPSLKAVSSNNLFVINSDLLTRPGPRVLAGTETLCQHLDSARAKRK